jgi:hypothetical protein
MCLNIVEVEKRALDEQGRKFLIVTWMEVNLIRRNEKSGLIIFILLVYIHS